jgi:hypothetical protein
VHGPAMLTGRAARGVTRLLREHGFDVVAEPESFLVTRRDRLEPNEQERARDWAAKLAAGINGANGPFDTLRQAGRPAAAGAR